MLAFDIIRPEMGPWSSNCLMVPKHDGTFRMVVDLRKLNAITTPISYKLPLARDVFSSVGQAKWFSVCDLSKAFWSINIREEDRQKTQFATPFGSYSFNRMWLKGASQFF